MLPSAARSPSPIHLHLDLDLDLRCSISFLHPSRPTVQLHSARLYLPRRAAHRASPGTTSSRGGGGAPRVTERPDLPSEALQAKLCVHLEHHILQLACELGLAAPRRQRNERGRHTLARRRHGRILTRRRGQERRREQLFGGGAPDERELGFDLIWAMPRGGAQACR